MKGLRLIGALILIASAVNGSKIVNSEFDKVLDAGMKAYGNKIDPYHVAEKRIGFERKLAFINWRGEIKLYNIVLDGLSDISRTGDAILTKNSEGSTTLTTTLRLPVLFFHADSVLRLMGIGPTAQHYGQLEETTINATIFYDPKLETVQLLNFQLHEITRVRFKIDGPTLITDAVTNMVLSATTKVFKNITRWTIQGVLRRALNSVVAESNILKHIMTEIQA